VIKPRGDLLKDKMKFFELHEAFGHPDEKFCSHWGISMDDLKEAKKQRSRKNDTERDFLWNYVDA
jgi:hypothetical protein